MKGFLHRVAVGVVRPRVTLHPLAQSIFDSPERISLDTFDASQGIASVAHSIPQPRPAYRDAESSTTQSFASRSIDPQEQFEPVVQSQHAQPSTLETSFGSRPKSDGRSTTRAEFLQANFGKLEGAASGEGAADGSFSVAGFTPSVVGRDAGVVRGEREQTLSSITPNNAYADAVKAELARMNGRRQALQPAPGLHSSSPQSDDIQIHIGRIEVVAVPQQVPRPVAPAPQKGISLDEYLGRRNGRSN
jgi:hypothetical protein